MNVREGVFRVFVRIYAVELVEVFYHGLLARRQTTMVWRALEEVRRSPISLVFEGNVRK